MSADAASRDNNLGAIGDDPFQIGSSDHDRERTGSITADAAPSDGYAFQPRVVRDLAARPATAPYLARLLVHPGHLIAVTGILVFALVNWSLLILVGGIVGEVILLGALPMLRAFRGHVDAAREEARCAAAIKAREAIVARLGAHHRGELGTIDRLVLRTRDSDRERGIAIRSMLDDSLTRLSEGYIRLALMHRACEEALATTNPVAIEDTIRSLESVIHTAAERLQPVVQRRLAIARRRLACCTRAKLSLEVIDQQLATIVDLVHLMYQQAMVPMSTSDPQADVDRFLIELEDTESAVREIEALGPLNNGALDCEAVASVA